jgi:PKD repeat protein
MSAPISRAWPTRAAVLAAVLAAGACSGDDGTSARPAALPEAPSLLVSFSGAQQGEKQLTAEYSHALAVTAGGGVVGWGRQANPAVTYGVPAGLTGVVAVESGIRYNYALKSDGTLVRWGYDDPGSVPPYTNVRAVSLQRNNLLVLKTDSTVIGYNVPAGLTGVVAVAAGDTFGVALKSTGRLVKWGVGGPTIPSTLTGVVAIAASHDYVLALKSGGTVVSLNGPAVPSGLGSVVGIAAGAHHALARRSDGTVVAWGNDYYGQTDVPAGLDSVVAVAAGEYFSLARRANGQVVAWGRNDGGQLEVPTSLGGPGPNTPPTAAFSATGGTNGSGQGITYSPVTFDASASSDPDGHVVSYLWDFDGNGTTDFTSTSPIATHTYDVATGYPVRLTVRDNLEATGTAVMSFTVVENQAPTAVIANGDPIHLSEGQLVTFSSAGSSDPDGQPLTYNWFFDDGYQYATPTVTRRFPDDGSFTVTLTVTDAGHETGSVSSTVVVDNVAPTARLKTPGQLLQNTAFTIEAANPLDPGLDDRYALKFSFDCGDGQGFRAFSSTPSASCAGAPTGTVRALGLRVRDKDGGQNEYTTTMTTVDARPVVTGLSNMTVHVGQTIQPTVSFTDAGGAGDAPFTGWAVWDAVNDVESVRNVTPYGTFTAPAYAYTTPGTYTLIIAIRDGGGATGRQVVTVTVNP